MNHLQILSAQFGGALLVRPVAAGTVINLAKPSVYNRVSAGTFPLPIVNTAFGRMVRVSDIADYLDALTPIQPLPLALPASRGRPTKVEQIEAARRGLTVRELRAQSGITLVGGAV